MKNLSYLTLTVLLAVNPKAEAMLARRLAGLITTPMYRALSTEPENFIDVGDVPFEQTEIAMPGQSKTNPFEIPDATEIVLTQAASTNDFSLNGLAAAYRTFALSYFNNSLEKSILETPVDNAIPVFARLHVRSILAAKLHDYIAKTAMKPSAKDEASIFWEQGPIAGVKYNLRGIHDTSISSVPLIYKDQFKPLYSGEAFLNRRKSAPQTGFLTRGNYQKPCPVVPLIDVTCTIAPCTIEHVQKFIQAREATKLEELKKRHAMLLAQVHSKDEKDLLAQELAKGIECFEKHVIAETAKYLDAVPQEIARLIE